MPTKVGVRAARERKIYREREMATRLVEEITAEVRNIELVVLDA